MTQEINGNNCHSSAASPRHQTWLTLVLLIFLVGGFWGLTDSFHRVDFYYTHFFEKSGVLSYNLLRTVFALYCIWIVYVTGYAFVSMLIPFTARQTFTHMQRFILGFATGLGCWHILMLALGYFNLYYRSIMLGICLIILASSARYFKDSLQTLAAQSAGLFGRSKRVSLISGVVVGASLVWLLMLRGLYPSGGGDYFTHYFYYYTNVIQNHGIAPNDVWYHYYYSKGAGLHFLGMLLMDPEAPSVMTFCCVAVASLALFNLLSCLSPRSYWPAFCATLYIIYNLIPLTGDGGEFQKVHEETTSMMIMGVWAICMVALQPKEWERPSFILLVMLVVGAAILTQATAVYFAFLFAALAGVALVKKQWRVVVFYVLLGAVTSIAIGGMLLMNYLVTGLATDQALNITWKFANLERLHQWGVIPNVMMVAWIRDNYDLVAVPWEPKTIWDQLVSFTRMDALKTALLAVGVGLILDWVITIRDPKRFADSVPRSQVAVRTVLGILGLVILVFMLLSVFVGHSQATSFFRFSSFFFPLLLLFISASWIYLCARLKWTLHLLPVLMAGLVIFSWHHWSSHVKKVSRHAVSFATGSYSLSDAYSHQISGLPFGGINPSAYAAMQQVPLGSRVWSTNVDSYCMAPNCQVESTISFKLSSNLNEILSGKPAEAKAILQREGLNYFIVSKNSVLIDLLPFSQLFKPSVIGQYLGIKWTDGSTYLLTWRDANTKPINASFLRSYKKLLKEAKHPWFRFEEAVPAMNETMTLITAMPHPWRPITFPWREDKARAIKIHHASYGKNCRISRTSSYFHLVSASNATHAVKELCQTKSACQFMVSVELFGNPVTGCSKAFDVSYRCLPDKTLIRVAVGAEALGKVVTLDCVS